MAQELLDHLTAVPARCRQHHLPDESYDRQIRDLITYLKQPSIIPGNKDIDNYLESINPSIHTLSFLYLLHARIQYLQNTTKKNIPEDVKPGSKLWMQVVRFLKTFDPIQIRYVGHDWRKLLELVGQAAIVTSKPLLAVKVIRDALLRLDPTPGTFTSVHLLFIRLCLLSRAYTYALPILNGFFCQFPANTDQAYRLGFEPLLCSEKEPSEAFVTYTSGFSAELSYKDHLQYFLYGAMVYMALKEWDRALHFLTIVISSPTSGSVSKIMVEAYKKWLLVSILGNGKLPATSKTIAPHVMRIYRSLARPYISLVNAFEQGDNQRMRVEIEIGQSVWSADNNLGLISQLIEAFDKYMVLKLGRTFSALTMADVVQRTPNSSKSLDDMEGFVASLVMSRALYATLSHFSEPGNSVMLRFSLSTQFQFFREEDIRSRLIKRRCDLSTINERVRRSNDALELCHENFHFLAKSQKSSTNSGKPSGIGSNEVGGGLDVDEDLMGDFN